MSEVPGRVVADRTIPPGGEWSGILARGQVLRIVDLEGRQAVDFLCYNAADPSERYNAADTLKVAGTIALTAGHRLYSDMGRPLCTIVADTVGRHDTIGGCCSGESNRLRYGVVGTPSCRDNFLRALARFGLGKKDIVANVNFFMNVPVAPDGAMAIAEAVATRRLRGPPGRDGRSGRRLGLPPDLQPRERRTPHADPARNLRAVQALGKLEAAFTRRSCCR